MIIKIIYSLNLLIVVLYHNTYLAMGDKVLYNQAAWLPVDEVALPVRRFLYNSEEDSMTILFNDYLQKTVIPDFFKYTQRYGVGCIWQSKQYNREYVKRLLLRYIKTVYFHKMADETERFAEAILDYIEKMYL